jgi:hypothetical protein
VADADLDALETAVGELRSAGWPAPEDPASGEDTELGGRDTIAALLSDEVSWLRQCADWLRQLDGGGPAQPPPGRHGERVAGPAAGSKPLPSREPASIEARLPAKRPCRR